jgi:hypothetical protein
VVHRCRRSRRERKLSGIECAHLETKVCRASRPDELGVRDDDARFRRQLPRTNEFHSEQMVPEEGGREGELDTSARVLQRRPAEAGGEHEETDLP